MVNTMAALASPDLTGPAYANSKSCPWCGELCDKDTNCNWVCCGFGADGVYRKFFGCGRQWCFQCGKKHCGQLFDPVTGARNTNVTTNHGTTCRCLDNGEFCPGGHNSHAAPRWGGMRQTRTVPVIAQVPQARPMPVPAPAPAPAPISVNAQEPAPAPSVPASSVPMPAPASSAAVTAHAPPVTSEPQTPGSHVVSDTGSQTPHSTADRYIVPRAGSALQRTIAMDHRRVQSAQPTHRLNVGRRSSTLQPQTRRATSFLVRFS